MQDDSRYLNSGLRTMYPDGLNKKCGSNLPIQLTTTDTWRRSRVRMAEML